MSRTKSIELTYPESRFVPAFIQTKGNRTEAAKIAYNTTSDNSAASIGSRLVKKKRVQDAITAILAKIDIEKVNEQTIVANIANMAFNSKSEAIKTKNSELLGRWKALFTDKVESSVNSEVRSHIDVATASTDALLDELTKRLKVSSTGTMTHKNGLQSNKDAITSVIVGDESMGKENE